MSDIHNADLSFKSIEHEPRDEAVNPKDQSSHNRDSPTNFDAFDDINDAFEKILLIEERLSNLGFDSGYDKGFEEGNVEGFHLGYHRGAEFGAELGYYSGIVDSYLENLKDQKGSKTEKIVKNLVVLQSLIDTFPKENSEDVDIIELFSNIRGLFKKVCTLLKIDSSYPEADKINF